jgi:hypothetical protein
MDGVICPSCQATNAADESFCGVCGHLLTDGAGSAAPSHGQAPDETPENCPACGAEVPEPTNLVCVDCLEPLTPRSSGATAPATLRLLFTGRPVEIPQPGIMLLGRDPQLCPVATLFASHDNISRQHASVGVDSDGTAWVRDEHSTNGTFVNNKPVPRGHTTPLTDGDQLRMGSDVTAKIELG